VKKSETKFLLVSMKSLTSCENPFSDPSQTAFYGFQTAACDYESFSLKAACDPEN